MIGAALRAMLESAVTYDKKLWAQAVLTSIYIPIVDLIRR